jgi:hypothetical protein
LLCRVNSGRSSVGFAELGPYMLFWLLRMVT